LKHQEAQTQKSLVGWVEVQNPTAVRILTLSLGFATRNPTYELKNTKKARQMTSFKTNEGNL